VAESVSGGDNSQFCEQVLRIRSSAAAVAITISPLQGWAAHHFDGPRFLCTGSWRGQVGSLEISKAIRQGGWAGPHKTPHRHRGVSQEQSIERVHPRLFTMNRDPLGGQGLRRGGPQEREWTRQFGEQIEQSLARLGNAIAPMEAPPSRSPLRSSWPRQVFRNTGAGGGAPPQHHQLPIRPRRCGAVSSRLSPFERTEPARSSGHRPEGRRAASSETVGRVPRVQEEL